jgi:hypothetical protein
LGCQGQNKHNGKDIEGSSKTLKSTLIYRLKVKLQIHNNLVRDEPKAPVVVQENPFHIPKDEEVFALREKERNARMELKEKLHRMSIYEKSHIQKQNYKDILKEEDDISDIKEIAKKKGKEILLLKKQIGGIKATFRSIRSSIQ